MDPMELLMIDSFSLTSASQLKQVNLEIGHGPGALLSNVEVTCTNRNIRGVGVTAVRVRVRVVMVKNFFRHFLGL